jgi:uncharacterized protein YjeT (DUF2065 family)
MVPITAGGAPGTWDDGGVREEGVPVGALLSSSAPQAARRLATKMRSASKKGVREGCQPAVGVGSRLMRSSFSFAFFATWAKSRHPKEYTKSALD